MSCEGFGGLDQRAGCSTGIKGLQEMVNFKINESGHLEKREGYSTFAPLDTSHPVDALWNGYPDGAQMTVAAAGKELFIYDEARSTFDSVGQMEDRCTCIFAFGDKLYALGGDMYTVNREVMNYAIGYVPLIATACNSVGAGTVYEQPNLLTAYRRIQYNGDGKLTNYALPEQELSEISEVTVNGDSWKDKCELSPSTGEIFFNSPPPPGINNVEVCYAASADVEAQNRIRRCKYARIFENRLFLYGNPDYPNYLFHTELADGMPTAEYFTESGYHLFDKPVKSVIPCFNRLLIFFEDSSSFTYAQLQTDSLGMTYTSFPIFELNASKGNLLEGVGVSFDNTPVTLCRDGLNKWVSTAISDERSAVVFSERAFKLISAMKNNLDSVRMLNRKNTSELWICSSEGTLIYNYALDCFYFYEMENITALCEYGEGLLIGDKIGNIYFFGKEHKDDCGNDIIASFVTPYCTFGAPYTLKSLTGVSVAVEGREATELDLFVTRGNKSAPALFTRHLRLPEMAAKGFRRMRGRLYVRRFYSCKIRIASASKGLVITSMELFGRSYDGNLRNN